MPGIYALYCTEMKLNCSVWSAELLFWQILSNHSFGAQAVIYHMKSRTYEKSDFFSWCTSKSMQFTGRTEGKKERNKVILGRFSRNSWNFFLSYSADCCINFGLILVTAKFAISIFIRSNTEKMALNKQTEKVIQGCRRLRGTIYKICYRLCKGRAETCMGNINRMLNNVRTWGRAGASMCVHVSVQSRK